MNLLRFNVQGTVDEEVQAPLGLLYLVAALERAGYDVDFVDHQTYQAGGRGSDPFDARAVAASFSCLGEVVGIGCMANLLPFTILVAERLKELHPDKLIVLGGVGPFAVEELVLTRFPWIDVICRGEGERTVLDLMRAVTAGRGLAHVAGIVYRDDAGPIVRNPDRPRIRDLDTIPWPAYDRLDPATYSSYNVVTNRGCPYGCTFCSVAPIWRHRTTYRDPSAVVAEIDWLQREYGAKRFLFQDEYFFSSADRVHKFCDALERSGASIQWKCFGRVNLVTEEAMREMADAGCIQIRFGVESGSDDVLRQVAKRFEYREADLVVRTAADIFPSVETFFMWGFPFEDLDDMRLTIDAMESLRSLGVNILPSLLSFLPGSEIHRRFSAGEFDGELTLRRELVPIYALAGFEVIGRRGNRVKARHAGVYDLVEAYPEVFPGFYLFDYERNVAPKLEMMREAGFA